jgi:cytochrome c biogenesis protein CcdA
MVRLLGLVIAIGLADSINPSTIAPALYLALGERPRLQVAEFTIAVFVVYLAGGALITLGPGEIIRSVIPDVDIHHTVRYIAELVAGVLLLGAAAWIWARRESLAARGLPQRQSRQRSSVLLGATITAVELPTAFPYFAAIAAIAGSGLNAAQQTTLLIVFNVCFVLPLVLILATLTFAGESSARIIAASRRFLERRWPHLLAGLILIVGAVAILLGATGLASGVPGRTGRFFRGVRRVLHHLRP